MHPFSDAQRMLIQRSRQFDSCCKRGAVPEQNSCSSQKEDLPHVYLTSKHFPAFLLSVSAPSAKRRKGGKGDTADAKALELLEQAEHGGSKGQKPKPSFEADSFSDEGSVQDDEFEDDFQFDYDDGDEGPGGEGGDDVGDAEGVL
jgi:hypothetical protein